MYAPSRLSLIASLISLAKYNFLLEDLQKSLNLIILSIGYSFSKFLKIIPVFLYRFKICAFLKSEIKVKVLGIILCIKVLLT